MFCYSIAYSVFLMIINGTPKFVLMMDISENEYLCLLPIGLAEVHNTFVKQVSTNKSGSSM